MVRARRALPDGNDLNTIWLHQHVAGYDRFVGYYENSGEFIGHYVAWLRAWAAERRASFDGHFIPHCMQT